MRSRGDFALKLDAIRERTTLVLVSKASARMNAIRAIRRLESLTGGALDGTHMLGLPELAPNFRGLRVRAQAQNRGVPLSALESVLILNGHGKIGYATRALGFRPARDEEIRSEDLEPFCETLKEALNTHLVRSSRAQESYSAIDELARRLCDAFGA